MTIHIKWFDFDTDRIQGIYRHNKPASVDNCGDMWNAVYSMMVRQDNKNHCMQFETEEERDDVYALLSKHTKPLTEHN